MSVEPALARDFQEELLALVDALEAELLGLAEAPGEAARPALDAVFRCAHNLKSAAAMLGQAEAAQAAHRLEEELEALREGRAPADSAAIDRLLAGADGVRARLSARPGPAGRALKVRVRVEPSPGPDPLALFRAVCARGEVLHCRADVSRVPPLARGYPPDALALAFEAELQCPGGEAALVEAYRAAGGAGGLSVSALEEGPARRAESLETMRVATRRVDALVDQAGELHAAAARLEHALRPGAPAGAALLAAGEARRLARSLQQAALAIRLVPLSPIYQALRRFVREQAGRLGKAVALELRGENVEVDKSVAQRLVDPLNHLVRNALDHGLESPEERQALGKPARARLRVAAREERGRLVLEVSDDGRGLDPERLRAAAIARGLLAPEEALSEAAAHRLIFRAGFSTAPTGGELSGRGVGLDAVRQNLAELGGEVQVHSRPGQGATFTLSVPLTVAALDGMLLRRGDRQLLVPLDAVEQVLALAGAPRTRLPDGRTVLHTPSGDVPLLSSAGALGPARLAVLLRSGGACCALEADEVAAQEAALLKPLPPAVRAAEGLLGAALLADGSVGLVLDPASTLERATLPSPTRNA